MGAGLVARKVLLDQLVFTPPMIATFFIGMSVLEGKQDVTKECRYSGPVFAVVRHCACGSRKKAVQTFLANLGFWIPVHVVNFRHKMLEQQCQVCLHRYLAGLSPLAAEWCILASAASSGSTISVQSRDQGRRRGEDGL